MDVVHPRVVQSTRSEVDETAKVPRDIHDHEYLSRVFKARLQPRYAKDVTVSVEDSTPFCSSPPTIQQPYENPKETCCIKHLRHASHFSSSPSNIINHTPHHNRNLPFPPSLLSILHPICWPTLICCHVTRQHTPLHDTLPNGLAHILPIRP